MILQSRQEVRHEVLAAVCADLRTQGLSSKLCPAPTDQWSTTIAAVPRLGGQPSSKLAYSAERFFGGVPGGTIDSHIDRADSPMRFELSASTANSKASVRVGATRSEGNLEHLTFSSTSATVSAPVNKQDDFTNLATLDGFANAAELALRYSKLVVAGAANPRLPDGEPSPRMKEVYDRAGLDPDIYYDLNLVKEALARKGMLALYPEFEALYWNPDSPRWVYGASARIGTEKFKYLPAGTAAFQSSRETPWAIGVYGGLIPKVSNDLYLGASLEYQDVFASSSPVTICPTEASGDVIECLTGAYGPPKQTDRLIVSLEGRKAFGGAGAILRLSHDLRSGDYGIDLPVHLFNFTSGLSSGFRLGWTNTDQFSLGVFVGAAFSLDRKE